MEMRKAEKMIYDIIKKSVSPVNVCEIAEACSNCEAFIEEVVKWLQFDEKIVRTPGNRYKAIK